MKQSYNWINLICLLLCNRLSLFWTNYVRWTNYVTNINYEIFIYNTHILQEINYIRKQRHFVDGLVSFFSCEKLLFQLLGVILIHVDVLVLVMMKLALVQVELHWKHCQQETDITSAIKGRSWCTFDKSSGFWIE